MQKKNDPPSSRTHRITLYFESQGTLNQTDRENLSARYRFANANTIFCLWEEFIKIIESSYYKGEVGNKPYPLELMLRIFILQNAYDLADMAVMNEVIDSRAFSDFCGINSPDEVPDGDTIGRFRNILTKNGLQEKIFAKVVKILTKRKLILKKGTLVDSTFIESPSSTRNKEKKRDPEVDSGKKGNTWHFGYKAHSGKRKDKSISGGSADKMHFRCQPSFKCPMLCFPFAFLAPAASGCTLILVLSRHNTFVSVSMIPCFCISSNIL